MDIKELNEAIGMFVNLEDEYSDKTFDIKESVNKDSAKWNEFETDIAIYLNNKGVKPEDAMSYINEHAKEIIEEVAVDTEEWQESDEEMLDLYYNCPISRTDVAQKIEEAIIDYLASAIKSCLTIEDKVAQWQGE